MNKLKLSLSVMVVLLAAAGCRSLTPQPAVTAGVATPAPAPTAAPTANPTQPATAVAPTPTLPAMPGPDVNPALDKNFRDPADAWCHGGSNGSDFFCQDGEFHLISKGYGNIASQDDAGFLNFILQAQIGLSAENEPYLGVDFAMLTPDIAASEGITGTQGALLGSVVPGSPAAEAGLSKGDVITARETQQSAPDAVQRPRRSTPRCRIEFS